MFSWSIRVQDSKGAWEGRKGAHQPIGPLETRTGHVFPQKFCRVWGDSYVFALELEQCVPTHVTADTRCGMCQNGWAYGQFQNTYIDIISIDVVWVGISFYGLQPHPRMIICKAKRKVIESNLLGCSEPQNVSPRHGDQSHPCCFKDKQRIKYYTPSTLLILLWKLGRIYNYLPFTAILINLFFYHWQAWGIGRGLKLPHWVLGITTVLFLRLNV